jgi:hypothetical protein
MLIPDREILSSVPRFGQKVHSFACLFIGEEMSRNHFSRFAPSIVQIRFKNQLLKLQFIQTLYPGILEKPKIYVYKICFNF